jgi:hypothetical protein
MGALLGLNIYRLPHGTTVLNAINGNNGASKWSYSPTEGQDSEIHIRPQDLGITGLVLVLGWLPAQSVEHL